jgi:hypothetical protein|tara:strand:- start:5374 stop:5592 length:219 start_codon:yes stop_codon:yes gene_type:complete
MDLHERVIVTRAADIFLEHTGPKFVEGATSWGLLGQLSSTPVDILHSGVEVMVVIMFATTIALVSDPDQLGV